MKAVLAVHGTRGDVEPCAAVGAELQRRGHEVQMAVPPNLVKFVESAGLKAVPYGPDSHAQLEEEIFRSFWRVRNPFGVLRPGAEFLTRGWADMGTTLVSLAQDADIIVSGQTYPGVPANVSEYLDIPMVALQYFPQRVHGHLFPLVPPPFSRAAMKMAYALYWWVTKGPENAQRRALGLPETRVSSAKRIVQRGSLEIQGYDDVFFPGLKKEWGDQRPFVGALTLELPTSADDEVAAWISAGTPPIYFGFGSMRIDSTSATVAMISEVCAELGARALICGGVTDFTDIEVPDNVMIVPDANHAAVFPACRAVVHHGGPGTLAAGMKAGVPTLVLWISAEQPLWAAQVWKLKIGKARRFAGVTKKSLLKDLRKILEPKYVNRAREIAERMTPSNVSVKKAADLIESRVCRPGPPGQLQRLLDDDAAQISADECNALITNKGDM
ncbi:glycosyltransferase [Mycobacterium riyadhense]|uniref:4'-demethylrebeccamycin synthase n=1 Tax=Mycobacterium riyadhense TaxID=486698 RepID=A0A653EKJ9_9MYCO|nr:glycosyltransferase [Mycobacterium riyadhense]VTO97265.1 4'-demethylrebeccamycin synthase [Mycobacterium riyadhense]